MSASASVACLVRLRRRLDRTGGRRGVSSVSENIHEYSITRGSALPRKKGDRMLVAKKIFPPAAIRKKEEHAGRYSIRA